MLSIKHTLASKTDSKATISNSEIKKLFQSKPTGDEIILYYHDYNCSIKYHSSRNGLTWYAESRFPSTMTLPKVGQPIFYNVSAVVDKVSKSMKLNNEFEPIREWARERALIKNGDIKTQTIKLVEEVGELSRAIIKDDYHEFIDSIGDIVVVLTNLCAIANVKIEDCINNAYEEIKDRKGQMSNGTFVKNEK